MKLIVGLGNPGKEYELSRHNAGFLVIDKMIADFGLTQKDWQHSKKANALYLKTIYERQPLEIIKPQTFMNNSGLAVAYALKKHELTPKDLIVVHDDKDIPVGEIRVQTNRGAAGHNGIKSIIDHLGTKDFTRVRIGVGPTHQEKIQIISNYVLNKFSKEEFKLLQTALDHAISEIKRLSLAK
jgi:PTH1 family peptidyl-tRNA hydrolase